MLDRPRILVAIALVALNVATFLPVRHYGFTDVDDPQYVSENPEVARGLTRTSIEWAFDGVHASYWIPVDWLSHMADVELYGMNPGKHHVTNLILHSIDTILLFAILFAATGATGPAALVAALFAVHPLHVESVVWITERKDVLSTLFWMLAMWSYLQYVRQPGILRYSFICISLILGLMTKPMLVTVPFALLLLDVWPLGRIRLGGEGSAAGRAPYRARLRSLLARLRPLLVEKAPLFGIAAAGAVLTLFTQRDALPALETIPLARRLANTVVSYGAYLGHTVWPRDLAFYYPYPSHVPAGEVVASGLLLLAITVWAVRTAGRRPYVLVGWLWYVGILFPVSGVVQAGTQAMADRFTYVPLIGIFIIIAWGGYELSGQGLRRKLAAATAGLLVLGAALAARSQVAVWKTNETLWRHAFESGHPSYVAHTSLGIALQERGAADSAIAHYRAALQTKPDYSPALNNLAVALANRGQIAAAIQQFREAVKYHPEQATVHHNLGLLLAQEGDTASAVEQIRAALRIDPGLPNARADLQRLQSGRAREDQ